MKSVVIITGANGLIGSEAVKFFADKFDEVVGIDNNMRKYFFGEEGSTEKNKALLLKEVSNYIPYEADIREYTALENIFNRYGGEIKLIIHAAAQPSHDWAAKEPFTDYHVNSTGTLNMLELTRLFCPNAVFIFTSTSKVYGDNPNYINLIELEKRWDVSPSSFYHHGFPETFSIDNTKHSLFGCSKVSADIYVQEYGRYFGLKTALFRPGCLTGSRHSSAELHGFLSYLAKCIVQEREYRIFGYKGKQVRCNIHSYDVCTAFWEVYKDPKYGEVYNLGGGRESSCSILEAIELIEKVSGKTAKITYVPENRIGDHIWWISDISKFQKDYPEWKIKYSLEDIIVDIINELK